MARPPQRAACRPTWSRTRRGGMGEAHLPTEQPTPVEEARVPSPDEHPRRTGDSQEPPGQGPSPAVGLTDSLRTRAEFERVRAEGRRFSSGITWCVYRPDDLVAVPRIAFGISRNVGSAVVRNRIRRRLRAILSRLVIPPGDFIFGASAAAARLPFDELRAMVTSLLERCATSAPGRP